MKTTLQAILAVLSSVTLLLAGGVTGPVNADEIVRTGSLGCQEYCVDSYEVRCLASRYLFVEGNTVSSLNDALVMSGVAVTAPIIGVAFNDFVGVDAIGSWFWNRGNNGLIRAYVFVAAQPIGFPPASYELRFECMNSEFEATPTTVTQKQNQ